MNCGKMACVLVVLWSALTVAQAPVPSPALPQTTSTSTDSPKDYSKESIVVESSVGRFWFENDGTGTRQLSVRMRIQSEAGVRQAGVLRLAYASALEALHIEYVRVHKPDGTVIETPADGAQDIASDVTQQAPTYSDVREKHIPVKSLAAGDLLEYSARWNLFKPVTPGHFSFASDFDRSLIYLEQKLEINVPRDRAVKLKSAELKPVITEQGARRVYTWTTSQLEHPSDKDQKKQQAQQQRQVRTGTLPPPAVRLSSFQSWEEVGRWYDGLQKERIEPTPEIQKRAAQLTRDATTENDKIRALYDYVSLRVRYVGVDLGVSAFQPHSAESVEGNGYGDCKDKHTLLATLLAAEGIHAYAALINTQRDLDTDVPSPSQFNHVVTAVETDKGIIWLDTTPEVAPFGWLLPPLRGKNALVVSAPAVLKKIPDAPPFPASQTFSMKAKIEEDGSLQGHVESTFRGSQDELLLRLAFRQTAAEKWQSMVQKLSSAQGFGGDVNDVSIAAIEQTSVPLRINYSYSRKPAQDWAERKTTAHLPPLALPAAGDEDARSSPLYVGAIRAEFTSTLELPKGYIPQLPRNSDLTASFAEYHCHYSWKAGALTTDRHFISKVQEVPVSELPEYKEFVKKISADEDRYINLMDSKSSKSDYQSEIWDLPDSANADASAKYENAREAFERKDFAAEIADVQEATKIDPKFTRAWLWLGEIYNDQRQFDLAVEADRKAVAVDPQEPISYKALAFTLLRAQRIEEALTAWQEFGKLSPQDPVGIHQLAGAYMRLKRYKEAAAVLEKGVQSYPEKAGMSASLAYCYVQSGDAEKAAAAYKSALALDPRHELYNTAAYELAEAGVDLPLALEFARKAVAELETTTAAIKLADVKIADLRNASNLAAEWDTLGWVLFKMGDLTGAQRYLNAAWRLSQSGVVGEHLGEVLEKQGNIAMAARVYRLAMFAAAHSPDTKDSINKRLEAMGEKVDRSPDGDSRAITELNRMRTVKLPRVTTATASAEVLILLGPGAKLQGAKLEEVKWLNGSAALKNIKSDIGADFQQPFPDDGPTRLVRRGMLACFPSSGCNLVLMPPEEVKSAQ